MPSCLPSHRTSALFVLSASREGHPLQQQQLRFRPIFADFSPFHVLDGRLKLQRNIQDGLDHEARWRRVGEYLLFPGTDGNPSCGSSKSSRKSSGANLRSPSNLRRLILLKSHFQEYLETLALNPIASVSMYQGSQAAVKEMALVEVAKLFSQN